MNREQMLLIVVFVLAIITAILLSLSIIILTKIVFLTKKYNAFMKGSDGISLERSVLTKWKEIEILKEKVQITSEKLDSIDELLKNTYQKISIMKYDSFKEMTGKLSFSLCLLDNENSGFILTSMHTREGCYSYVKEIIKGEAFVILSLEEKKVLEEAKDKKILYAE